jgi:hypothetical protein
MAVIELREREPEDWKPEHNDIDWLAKRQQKLGELGLQAVELWFVIEENGEEFELQVTQDNCLIELNFVEPATDCLSLQDPRDNLYWLWYRGEMGDAAFEERIASFAPFAMKIDTLYPRPNTASTYLIRQERNLLTELEQGLDGLSHGDL